MLTRKQFISRMTAALAWMVAGTRFGLAASPQPHMADGIKIGEVDSHSAIVWGRLTAVPDMVADGLSFRDDDGVGGKRLDLLSQMNGSVPGIDGEMRVVYWPENQPDNPQSTHWAPVDTTTDFTHQFRLKSLQPATQYILRVEGRLPDLEDEPSIMVEGHFGTAPLSEKEAAVSFAVLTCQEYLLRDDPVNGHTVYSTMGKHSLDFMVHTGDLVYYDQPEPYSTTVESARFKWRRIYAEPYLREFHRSHPTYFMKDDHDVLRDDAWPGQRFGDLTFAQGLEIYREQVPVGPLPYRTVRWGRDVQLWLMEGREFRTPNTEPDGPDKSIWGSAQKQWFYETFEQSDAAFRILVTPTPLVGPDKEGKWDNHANGAFKNEGDELRAYLSRQKNAFVVTGDRHWQYVSVDPVSGLREFSVGPTTDAHARGYSEEDRTPMHQYLRVKGGFFHVEVFRKDGVPCIALRHRGVDGTVHHEEIYAAS